MFVNCPPWIDKEILTYNKVDDIPRHVFDRINAALIKNQTIEQPLVSVVIPALNEELNIIRTLSTLANNIASFPFEIVVVNNNSTDKTEQVLKQLCVRTVFQPKPGCGPARQLGQEAAIGEYILMADADCFYPPGWINQMTNEISREGVSCVYGGYSFLTEFDNRRLGLKLYEWTRGTLVWIKHFKRPYLNALGMNMAYVKKFGLQVGFVESAIRGEDGRMCFDLMQFGRVVRVRDKSCNVWTSTRTLDKEGSLLKAFVKRLFIEITRLNQYFTTMKAHNTKTSKNRR